MKPVKGIAMKHTPKCADDQSRDCEIEFIGGPYDGHKEIVVTRPIHLPADVGWFVCEDIFRMINGKDSRPCGSITSVALYELAVKDDSYEYRFARTVSVDTFMQSLGKI